MSSQQEIQPGESIGMETDRQRLLMLDGWVVNLRYQLCQALEFLRLHPVDCQHCASREQCWGPVQKRLEELRLQELLKPESAQAGDDKDGAA